MLQIILWIKRLWKTAWENKIEGNYDKVINGNNCEKVRRSLNTWKKLIEVTSYLTPNARVTVT